MCADAVVSGGGVVTNQQGGFTSLAEVQRACCTAVALSSSSVLPEQCDTGIRHSLPGQPGIVAVAVTSMACLQNARL